MSLTDTPAHDVVPPDKSAPSPGGAPVAYLHKDPLTPNSYSYHRQPDPDPEPEPEPQPQPNHSRYRAARAVQADGAGVYHCEHDCGIAGTHDVSANELACTRPISQHEPASESRTIWNLEFVEPDTSPDSVVAHLQHARAEVAKLCMTVAQVTASPSTISGAKTPGSPPSHAGFDMKSTVGGTPSEGAENMGDTGSNASSSADAADLDAVDIEAHLSKTEKQLEAQLQKMSDSRGDDEIQRILADSRRGIEHLEDLESARIDEEPGLSERTPGSCSGVQQQPKQQQTTVGDSIAGSIKAERQHAVANRLSASARCAQAIADAAKMIEEEAAWRPAPVARPLKRLQQEKEQASLPEEGVPLEGMSAVANGKRASAALKQRDIEGIAHNMPIEMLASTEIDDTSPPWWCHVGPRSMLKPFTTEINVKLVQPAIVDGEGVTGSVTSAREHERQVDDVDAVAHKPPQSYTVVVEISP